MTENRVILIKHPGTIIRIRKILLRNGGQLSELAKFCSGTGYNHQISRNSAQERGTIIRISEILLRNWGQSSELAKFCSGTGDNHQFLR